MLELLVRQAGTEYELRKPRAFGDSNALNPHTPLSNVQKHTRVLCVGIALC